MGNCCAHPQLQLYCSPESKIYLYFQLIVPEYKAFVSMATAVSGIVENDVDGYWITARFYKIIEKSKEAFGPLVNDYM